MKIHFEELRSEQRLGGIEAATVLLQKHLLAAGVTVTRSSAMARSDASPDCVHIHGIWSPSLARRFQSWKRKGVPCVVSPHGMLEPWALAHKALKKKFAWHLYQKRLLNSANALHATSEREAGHLKALGLNCPVSFIPWGVDIPSSFPFKSTFSSGDRIALFVGRLYPVKGLPMLIEAWARVRPVGWKLKIVGPDEGGHRAELEAQIGKLYLQKTVEFTGELTGQPKNNAFSNADLFILPTYSENFGIAIGEALAHGVPVITTQGAPWELLRTERCGWWTPVSVEGLSAALREATTLPPEVLDEMGARGREVVRQRFSWSGVATKMSRFYEWILKGGTPLVSFLQ